MTSRTWFITGVSSGFGRIMTEQLLARGDRVVGTVRQMQVVDDIKAKYGERFYAAQLDVTDTAAIKSVVNKAFDDSGRIDVIVNNAAYGLFGAAEEVTDEQISHHIATNLIGSIYVIRTALPHLRRQGGGRIIQFSSIAGQYIVVSVRTECNPLGCRTLLNAVDNDITHLSKISALQKAAITSFNDLTHETCRSLRILLHLRAELSLVERLCAHTGRLDDSDADVERSDFLHDGLDEAFDTELRRRIQTSAGRTRHSLNDSPNWKSRKMLHSPQTYRNQKHRAQMTFTISSN